MTNEYYTYICIYIRKQGGGLNEVKKEPGEPVAISAHSVPGISVKCGRLTHGAEVSDFTTGFN